MNKLVEYVFVPIGYLRGKTKQGARWLRAEVQDHPTRAIIIAVVLVFLVIAVPVVAGIVGGSVAAKPVVQTAKPTVQLVTDKAVSGGLLSSSVTPGVSVPTVSPTLVPTAMPTAIPATATLAPTVAPTQVPTAIPATATSAPTTDPNKGKTQVTLKDGKVVYVDLAVDWEKYPTAAMKWEFDTKVARSDNPRPQAYSKPAEVPVDVNETVLLFSEGTYTVKGSEPFTVTGGYGIDSAVFVTNTGQAPMTFQLAGYASTGYSMIRFKVGVKPNTALWGRYGLARSEHCGLASIFGGGCNTVYVTDVVWDGAKASVTKTTYIKEKDSLPIDNTALTNAQSNSDWEKKNPAQAVKDEQILLSQKPEKLGVNASIGVTFGKPILLVCQSGVISGPNNASPTVDLKAIPRMSYVVALWNNVGDTVIFQGVALTGCTMYEYAGGNVPHPELYARATIGFADVEKSSVYILDYNLLNALEIGTKAGGPTVFDKALGK